MSENLIKVIRTRATWNEISWEDIPSSRMSSRIGQGPVFYIVDYNHTISYVDAKIKEESRKFNCEYQDFRRLVYEENAEFFESIKRLYKKYNIGYQKNHPDLKKVYRLFKMPSAEGFSYDEPNTVVFPEVTTKQLAAIFTTIIEQMVPEGKWLDVKKYFNI